MILPPTGLNDLITGAQLSDTIVGYLGHDTLVGLRGDDIFIEGVARWGGGDVTLPGETVPYLVHGTSYDFGGGNDVIYGGGGFDVLLYVGLPDPIRVDLGLGVVTAGNGTDQFMGIEKIIATAGNDTVSGRLDNFEVVLGAGNDVAQMIGRYSLYNGGLGRDTLDLRQAIHAVTVDLTAGRVEIGKGLHAFAADFENVWGALTQVNHIAGGAEANNLHGGDAGNSLSGGGGRDFLIGGLGEDSLFGGFGDDVLGGGAGDDGFDGGVGNDRIFAGSGDDVIVDLDGNATIYGGLGADDVHFTSGVAYGGVGADRFMGSFNGQAYGGAGADLFEVRAQDFGSWVGGAGNDRFTLSGSVPLQGGLHGGEGFDRLALTGPVSVMVGDFEAGLSLEQQRQLVTGVEAITSATGGVAIQLGIVGVTATIAAGDNHITVSADACTVRLGDGADRVDINFVTSGTVNTGAGNDTIAVEISDGVVDVAGGAGADTLTLNGAARVDMGTGDDLVWIMASYVPEDTHVTMGAGNDTVVAIDNFAGIDLGAGQDRMVFHDGLEPLGSVLGGSGADVFEFQLSAPFNTYVLADFNADEDRLDLSALAVSGLGDVTLVTQDGADCVLFIREPDQFPGFGLTVVLAGTTAAEVTDALFL